MIDKSITLDGLNSDVSGMRDARKLQRGGWESVPVVTFGEIQYAILSHDTPHEGHNTAEVVNITEFNEGSAFRIAVTTEQRKRHTDGAAWMFYADEGIGILTVYVKTGELHEFPHPYTAVLSYRITPPTADDIEVVTHQLDDELQEYGIRSM